MFRGQQDNNKSPKQESSRLTGSNNNIKSSNYNLTASTASINTSLPNTKLTQNTKSSLQSIQTTTTGGGSMPQPGLGNMYQTGGFNQLQQTNLQTMPGGSTIL